MEIAKKTLTVCGIALAFIAVLYFFYLSKTVLMYLLVAVILAIAINPVVIKLKKLKIERVGASIISIVLLVLILFGILGAIIVPLVRQGIDFAQNLPTLTHTLQTNPTFLGLNEKYHLADNLDELSSRASQLILGGSTSLLFITTNVITVISAITIIIVLTFLLLLEGEHIWRRLMQFLSAKNAETAERVGTRIMKAISGFVSGNLLISLIAGVVTLITLWILDVPYMFALAALVALFDLIPLVGAAIATIAVGLIALTKGFLVAAIAVGVLLVYQFVEGHFIQPLVYSRSISLSALLVVIATLIGAEIAGIVGILLAIPLAAVIQILATETYAFFKFAER